MVTTRSYARHRTEKPPEEVAQTSSRGDGGWRGERPRLLSMWTALVVLILVGSARAGTYPTCPAGFSCTEGTGAVIGACLAGEYSLEGDTACAQCPAGKSCPAANEIPQLCPAGTYRLGPGVGTGAGSSPWHCETCPAGYDCSGRDGKTACSTSAGQVSYSLEGDAYCSICPSGSYCPNTSGEPVSCPEGWYSAAGAGECTVCPQGKFCPSSKIAAPLDCPEGTYSPLAGMTTCISCPAGHACPSSAGVAATAPTLCDANVISLGHAAACSAAIPGYSITDRGAEPQICPPGTQRGGSTADPSCLLIAAGKSGAFTSDDSGGVACSSGEYRALDGGAASCRSCPVGHTCSSTAVLPAPCDYSSSGCNPPSSGQFKSNHFETPSNCPAGTFAIGISFDAGVDAAFILQNGIGDAILAGGCHACPPGYLCPTATAKPTACAVGSYSLGNSTACTQCPAGSSCPTTTTAPTPCGRGSYSAAGQTSCTACPAGEACPTPYAADKVSCSSEQYSLTSQSFCSPCPIGYSCSSPSAAPQRCPGQQTSALGATACADVPDSQAAWSTVTLTACPSGYYSPQGAVSCYACPAGYGCSSTGTLTACTEGQFSGRGHSACYSCPKGFQCPFRDQAVIQQCPPGTYSLGDRAFCIECPENKQCPHRDSVAALKDGFWSPAGTGVALVCPAGTICKQEGISTTAAEQVGGVARDYATDPKVERCPYGTWSEAGNTAATCTPTVAGTAGLLTDSKGFACAEGFISEAGWSHCAPCEEGEYWKAQPDNTAEPYVCASTPLGSYSLHSHLAPVACPAASYGSWSNDVGGKVARTTVQCQPCGAGALCPERSVDATGRHIHADKTGSPEEAAHPCPPGYFCNSQDEYAARFPTMPCPAGKYATPGTTDQTSEAGQCSVCPAGFYCRLCELKEADGCTSGSSAGAGGFKVLPCPKGHYCPAGVRRSTEFPCPAGTYNADEGSSSAAACAACPIGSYCLQGASTPYACPPGSYCHVSGIRDPQEHLAPAGIRLPVPSAQSLPAAGDTDVSQNQRLNQRTAATCVAGLCPPGSSRTYPCPGGYYTQDARGADAWGGAGALFAKYQCTLCDEHKVCPTMAEREVSGTKSFAGAEYDCKKGYLCPKQTEHWEQKPCPPGSWDASATGTSLTSPTGCTTCPQGFACSEGTGPETASTGFAAGTIGRKRTYCEPGHYCPAGTLHDRQYKCPGGTYSVSTSLAAAAECTACPAGSYCPPGSSRPQLCPAGYYCPASADGNIGTVSYADFPCPSGSFGDTEDHAFALGFSLASQCTSCPAGHFCKSWTVTPQRCPVGSYMPDASAQAADEGNAATLGIATLLACRPCSAGYSCPREGLTAMQICPAGTYSPAQSATCFDCRSGHICLTAGLTEAKYATQLCPAGEYCAGKATAAVPCSLSRYCAGGQADYPGSWRSLACPVGTYATALRLSSVDQCIPTGAGHYTDTAASLERQGTANECEAGHRCPTGAHSGYQEACEPGYHQDERGQGLCKPCPAGSYCTGTTSRPTPCPQGHYCEQKSSEPIQCPVGTFGATTGLTAEASCSPCLAGHYCAQAGLEFPDGLCDPGSYCIGGASISAPRDGKTGSVCPKGGYCEMGSRRPHNCPPGTYNGATGGKSRYDCTACPPGQYCQGTSSAQPDGPCAEGYYCPARSQTPMQKTTLPGYYSKAGQGAPTPCPAGTYGPFTAQAACIPCPAGFYCPDAGMTDSYLDCPKGHYCPAATSTTATIGDVTKTTWTTEPIKCPAGTYSNVLNRAAPEECKPCRPGWYCSTPGLVAPLGECQPGYFCTQSSVEGSPPVATPAAPAVPDAGPCPAGHYCPLATPWPLPCPVGTFSAATKAKDVGTCETCTAGQYCPLAGQAAPAGPCDVGYLCPAGSKQSRPSGSGCAPGNKCPAGSPAAIPCPAGTYQSQGFQEDCLACPAGYYCLQGATEYVAGALSGPCPAGHHCPAQTPSATANPCRAGYYSPLPGAKDACLPCDPGSYCGASGLTKASGLCAEGYYCTGGSTTAEPVISFLGPAGTTIGDRCAAGYYCPAGSIHPVPCPPGKACPEPGLATAVTPCAAGYYCRSAATTATPTDDGSHGGNSCRPGFYCPAGAGWPTACRPGTYNPEYRAAQPESCLPCLAGTYCGSAGLAAPTDACAAGYFCPAGSASARPTAGLCPAGSACPAVLGGAKTHTPCASGTYQPHRGQTACLPCPAGYRCTASARIGECGVDHYCPLGVDGATLCPAGTYTKQTTAATPYQCGPCPPGKYCAHSAAGDAVLVQPCPVGRYCAGGAATAAGTGQCGVGVVCPAGSAVGQPCPPGSACSEPGQGVATASCAAGWYCLEGATTQRPTDGLTGDACPAGHYCPSAAKWPTPCPIGTYQPLTERTALQDCLACEDSLGSSVKTTGVICNALGATERSLPCPGGYYCPLPSAAAAGAVVADFLQVPCPAGHQCPEGSAASVACLAATYQPDTHQAACLSCPEGYFCDGKAAGSAAAGTVATLCPAGSYCSSGSSAAEPCPAGTFNPFQGKGKRSECTPCLQGYFCDTAGMTDVPTSNKCSAGRDCPTGSSAATTRCPAGSYCPAVAAAPRPCPIGTYSELPGGEDVASCLSCPANYYCPLRGATAGQYGGFAAANAYACGAGYRCLGGVKDLRPVPAAGQSEYCEVGHACPQEQLLQQPCPVGQYQPNVGQAACIRCPPGTLCQAKGLAQPAECPAGSYCPGSSSAGAAQVVACPAGTYSAFPGQASVTDCIPCPEGEYCETAGLTTSTGLCAAGYHCPSGASSSAPSRQAEVGDRTAGKCPAGHACPQGIAIPCPPGEYADVAQAVCATCPAGKYCPRYAITPSDLPLLDCAAGYYCTSGSTTPNPTTAPAGGLCPPDRYCPAGSSVPRRCEPGTYEMRGGSAACQSCPPGFYCSEGVRLPCSGGYCPAGSATPTPCPDGFHDNGAARLSSAVECAYCPAGEYCTGGVRRGGCSAGYYCDFGAAVASQGAAAVQRVVTAADAVLVVQALFLIDASADNTATAGYLESISTLASLISTRKATHTKLTFEAAVIGFYDVAACPSRAANKILDFTTDITALASEAASISKGCSSGDPDIAGDQAQALRDGLDSTKLRWRTTAEHVVYLLTDSPAHGHQYWSSTAVAALSNADSLAGSAAGTIEALIARYCSELAAKVQLLDLPWPASVASTPAYYTSQMFDMIQAAQPSCVTRITLQTTGSSASTLPALITTTLTGHLDTASTAAAAEQSSVVTYASKKCPRGHYCLAGVKYPARCGPGRYTSQTGSASAAECVDCPAGSYCRAKDNAAHLCPKGHWCPAGAEEPWACSIGTFNSYRGQTAGTACHDCPPGAYCNTEGTGDWRDHKCPAGYYCPRNSTAEPVPCPAGTYLNSRGADASADCIACPAGFHCPMASMQPEPCKNGTHCPSSSEAPVSCPPGTYCPFLSSSPRASPQAFYQPKTGSDFYVLCPNGTYCGAGSRSPSSCPSGYFGSSIIQSTDFTSGCRACDPGFYAPQGVNTCLPCEPGYVCLGAAGSAGGRRRLEAAREAGRALLDGGAGYTCPPGYYCPPGAGSEKACPVGTHQPKQAQYSITACIACAAGTHGYDVGLSECSPCQGSSNSEPGSSSCQCLGLNRIFLRDVGKCICETGHVPSDGSSAEEDSDVDCQKMVYERCSSDDTLDSNGVCRAPSQCDDQCDGGYGIVDPGLGICTCESSVSAKDVCDSRCRSQMPLVTFTATGDIKVRDLEREETRTFARTSLTQLAGMAKCQLKDAADCKILSLGKDATTGDFLADFQPPAILGLPKRRLHSQSFMQGEIEDGRSLQGTGSSAGINSVKAIKNPVVCLTAGSALLFEGLSAQHHPVYRKNSLLNSNNNFDFGGFLKLSTELKDGRSRATSFVFTFAEAGIYVFRDSENSAKETMVAVMGGGGACPSGLIYESKSSATLLRAGASVSDDLALTPDWTFFLASCIGFLVLIVMTAVIVSYVYNKNWDQDPARKAVMYQRKQYKKLKNSDIEDPKALVSINSEASSFQFRQQGKTDAFMAVQQDGTQDEQQKGKSKNRHEVQALDLEELENLKEGLDLQVAEMRKLYSKDDCLELSDDEGDGDLNTQILQLKRLLEQNKAVLQGDEAVEADGDHIEASSDEEDDAEKERQLKKQKQAEEAEFEQQQEREAAEEDANANMARDGVAEQALGDIADRAEEFAERLKRQGSFSEFDTQNLLAEVDATCESMERALEEDKARQQDLLKRRLEARRRKRAKLQQDLEATDEKVKTKEEEYGVIRDDIVEKHAKEYRERCAQYDGEYEAQTKALDQSLKEQKHDKLSAYEDKLKEANKSTAFSKVLDEYKGAQDKVDKELDKQREKEMSELQRRLKNRRNKAKSEKELKTQEELKALEEKKDLELADLKAQRRQIAGLLAADAARDDTKDKQRDIPEQDDRADQQQKQHKEVHLDEAATRKAEELAQRIKDAQDEQAELEKRQRLQLRELAIQAERENAELAKEEKEEAEKAELEAKESITASSQTVQVELDKRKELKRKIEEAQNDPEERAALMAALEQTDADIAAKMAAEAASQQQQLADRLAKRRGRRTAQARRECDLKVEQSVKRGEQQQQVENQQKMLRDEARNAKFEAKLDNMLMEKTVDELPAAVITALDEKHQEELDDLLMSSYKQRATELKDRVLAMLEEKLQGQTTIRKNFRARSTALDARKEALERDNGGAVDEAAARQLEESKETLAAEERKELQELEKEHQLRKSEAEQVLQERALRRESEQVQALQAAQLAERQRVTAERLNGALVKHLLDELDEDAAATLEAFRKEQEEQIQAKKAELERERRELEKQLDEELKKLDELKHKAKAVEGDQEDSAAKKRGALVRKQSNMSAAKLSGVQFQQKNKQAIKALAKQGSEAYDELTQKFVSEKERQLQALGEQMEARTARRRQVEEAKAQEQLAQEEKERQRIEALMESRKAAQERFNVLAARIQSHKKVTFKGGFSQAPIEQFNKIQNDRKVQLEELGNEPQKRAQNAAQLQKLTEILTKIDQLDLRIKSDVKSLKYGQADPEDISDAKSTKSRAQALGRRRTTITKAGLPTVKSKK